MATANNLVTYEDAVTHIGVLPSLEPRSNSKYSRVLTKALAEALQGIPAYQSQRFGSWG